MKIAPRQQNMYRTSMPNTVTKDGMNRIGIPKNSVTFGSNLPVKFTKMAGDVIKCDNATRFIDDLDELFGSKYFTEKLKKAGVNLKNLSKDDDFTIIDRNFLKDDFCGTLKVLFVDAPMTIVRGAFKLVGKENAEFIQKWQKGIEETEARNFVLDVIEEYSGKKYGVEVEEKLANKFVDSVTSNVAKVKKNYASRDERTINRIVTSAVSAFFAGADFYNISMLQNDDKKQANKARDRRLEQEFKRLGLNAACTFIGLGMFDRYTKKSLFANAIVIAVSAFFAEIISRCLSKTPLLPLKPEEARKIYEKRKQVQEAKEKQTKAQENKQVNFKANPAVSNSPFNAFATSNGSFAALNVMQNQIVKENAIEENAQKVTVQNENQNAQQNNKDKKGTTTFAKGVAIACGIATAYYLFDQLVRGNYKALMKKSKFIKENADAITSADGKFAELSQGLKDAVNGIVSENNNTGKKHSYLLNFKKACQYEKIEVDTVELASDLQKLKTVDVNNEISGLLDRYIEHAKKFEKGGFKSKTERFIVSGVVTGFTRIAETIYEILRFPVVIAEKGIKALTGLSKSEKVFDKIAKEVKPNKPDIYEEQLTALQVLISKNKDKIKEYVENPDKCSEATRKDLDKLIETIAKRARNVEIGSETGQLAHTSRTMVTAISTIFFVNDYKNSVLIESAGKDIEGANAEMQTRIWHKVFNFIINGTLMNLFNTIFKNAVNGSLVGAAAVATATEMCNESLIRKALCQPIRPRSSRQELIDFDAKQDARKGLGGTLSRGFKKLTGKKSLVEKAGINKTQKA